MHEPRTQIPFHHLGLFLVVFVAFLAWFPSPQVRTIQQVAAANCTPGSDGCSNMALPPADGNINKTVDAKTQQAKEDPEPQNGKSYTTSALNDSKEKAKAAEAAAKKEAADVAAAEAKLNAANAKSNYLPGVAAERAVARNQLLSERVQKAKADAEKKRADEDLKDRETHPGRRRLIGEKGDVIKDCTVSTCKAEDLQGWANKPAADGGAVAPSAGGTSALAPQTSIPLAGTVLSTPGSAGVDPFASQSANSGSGAPAPLAPSASPMDVAKASLGADTTAGQQGPALGAPSGSLGGLSPSGSSGLAGTTLGPANPVTAGVAVNTFGQGSDASAAANSQPSLMQSAKTAAGGALQTIKDYAGNTWGNLTGAQNNTDTPPSLAKTTGELRASLESGSASRDVLNRERAIALADVADAKKSMTGRSPLGRLADNVYGPWSSGQSQALKDAEARLASIPRVEPDAPVTVKNFLAAKDKLDSLTGDLNSTSLARGIVNPQENPLVRQILAQNATEQADMAKGVAERAQANVDAANVGIAASLKPGQTVSVMETRTISVGGVSAPPIGLAQAAADTAQWNWSDIQKMPEDATGRAIVEPKIGFTEGPIFSPTTKALGAAQAELQQAQTVAQVASQASSDSMKEYSGAIDQYKSALKAFDDPQARKEYAAYVAEKTAVDAWNKAVALQDVQASIAKQQTQAGPGAFVTYDAQTAATLKDLGVNVSSPLYKDFKSMLTDAVARPTTAADVYQKVADFFKSNPAATPDLADVFLKGDRTELLVGHIIGLSNTETQLSDQLRTPLVTNPYESLRTEQIASLENQASFHRDNLARIVSGDLTPRELEYLRQAAPGGQTGLEQTRDTGQAIVKQLGASTGWLDAATYLSPIAHLGGALVDSVSPSLESQRSWLTKTEGEILADKAYAIAVPAAESFLFFTPAGNRLMGSALETVVSPVASGVGRVWDGIGNFALGSELRGVSTAGELGAFPGVVRSAEGLYSLTGPALPAIGIPGVVAESFARSVVDPLGSISRGGVEAVAPAGIAESALRGADAVIGAAVPARTVPEAVAVDRPVGGSVRPADVGPVRAVEAEAIAAQAAVRSADAIAADIGAITRSAPTIGAPVSAAGEPIFQGVRNFGSGEISLAPSVARAVPEVSGVGNIAAPTIEGVIASAPAANQPAALATVSRSAEPLGIATPRLGSIVESGTPVSRTATLVGDRPFVNIGEVAFSPVVGSDAATVAARAAQDVAARAKVADILTMNADEIAALTPAQQSLAKAIQATAKEGAIPETTLRAVSDAFYAPQSAGVVGKATTNLQDIAAASRGPANPVTPAVTRNVASDIPPAKPSVAATAEAPRAPPVAQATTPAAPRRTLGQWFQDQLGLGKSFSGTTAEGELTGVAGTAAGRTGAVADASALQTRLQTFAAVDDAYTARALRGVADDLKASGHAELAARVIAGDTLSTAEASTIERLLNARGLSADGFASSVQRYTKVTDQQVAEVSQAVARADARLDALGMDVKALSQMSKDEAVARVAGMQKQLEDAIAQGKLATVDAAVVSRRFVERTMQLASGNEYRVGQIVGIGEVARGNSVGVATGGGKTLLLNGEAGVQRLRFGDAAKIEISTPDVIESGKYITESTGRPGYQMQDVFRMNGLEPVNVSAEYLKGAEGVAAIKEAPSNAVFIVDTQSRGFLKLNADTQLKVALDGRNLVRIDEVQNYASSRTSAVLASDTRRIGQAEVGIEARVNDVADVAGFKKLAAIDETAGIPQLENLSLATKADDAFWGSAKPAYAIDDAGRGKLNEAAQQMFTKRGFDLTPGSADSSVVDQVLGRWAQKEGAAGSYAFENINNVRAIVPRNSTAGIEVSQVSSDTAGQIAIALKHGYDPASIVRVSRSSAETSLSELYGPNMRNGAQLVGLSGTPEGTRALAAAKIGQDTVNISTSRLALERFNGIFGDSTEMLAQVPKSLENSNALLFARDPETFRSLEQQALAGDLGGNGTVVSYGPDGLRLNGKAVEGNFNDYLKLRDTSKYAEENGNIFIVNEQGAVGRNYQGNFSLYAMDVPPSDLLTQLAGRVERPISGGTGYWQGERYLLADDAVMAEKFTSIGGVAETRTAYADALRALDGADGVGPRLLDRAFGDASAVPGATLDATERATLYSKIGQVEELDRSAKFAIQQAVQAKTTLEPLKAILADSSVTGAERAAVQGAYERAINAPPGGGNLMREGTPIGSAKDTFIQNALDGGVTRAQETVASIEKVLADAPQSHALQTKIAAWNAQLKRASGLDVTEIAAVDKPFARAASLEETVGIARKLGDNIVTAENVPFNAVAETRGVAVAPQSVSAVIADTARTAASSITDGFASALRNSVTIPNVVGDLVTGKVTLSEAWSTAVANFEGKPFGVDAGLNLLAGEAPAASSGLRAGAVIDTEQYVSMRQRAADAMDAVDRSLSSPTVATNAAVYADAQKAVTSFANIFAEGSAQKMHLLDAARSLGVAAETASNAQQSSGVIALTRPSIQSAKNAYSSAVADLTPTPTVPAQMNVAANDTTVEDVSVARGRIIADAQAKIDAIQASAGTSPQARDEANVNERANAVRAERDSALAQLDTAQQTPPGAVVSPLGTAAKVMTNAVASLVPGLGTASAVSQSSIPTAALKTIQTIADRIAGWLGFGSATDLADVTPGDSLDSTEETNAIAMLNQITERAGMPVLVRNASLAYAAKLYAPVMGFDADGKPLHVPVEGNTPAYRGGKAGYGTAAAPGAGQTLVGENLAAGSGFTDFSAVISAWMQSPAHRAVLLNADVRDIGIGYAVVGGETRWVVMVGVRDFHGTVTEARPVSSLLQDTPTSVSIGGAANEGSLTTAVAVPSSDIEATLRAALPGSMVPASVQNVDPRLQEMDARLQQLEEKIRALQTENGQCIDPSMGQGASAALALVDCSPVSIQQRNEQIASLIQEAQQLDSDLKALKMGPQSAAPAESKMAASPPSPTASVPSTQNITDTGQPGGATAPTARPITQTSAPAEASASKGDGTAVIQYTAPVTPLGQFLVDNALSLAENVSAPFAWRNAAYYRSIKLALDGSDIAPNEPVRLLYHRHAAAALAESHDVMAALESAGVPQATRNDVEAAYEAVTGTYTSITGMVITSRGDIDRPVLSQLDADVAQELTLARQRALESGADVGVIRQAIQRANQQATHDALTLYAIAHHYPDGADIVARLAANDPTLITQGQPGTTAQGFVANRTAPTALAQALRAAAFAGLTIAQTLSGTPGSIATTPTPQQQGTSVATQVQQDDMQILAPIIAVAEQARAQAIDAQTPFAAVTPLAQENVRFLDTAFKDTVAGKLADAAERGRRLAILKQVVASRIAAGGLTYPEFLLMNDIGAALTGIQTPLSATREIFPASWQSSQMDSTSQMADFSALALALRGTPAQGFDLDNLMIPVAQKAITARIANYAVARGIHLGGLSAGVLPVAVDGRFFDTFTLLQHDYVHRADFLAAYNALSIAQRAGFRNLYLSWYNSAGSIAHDTRDKADLIFFTLWHEPRMADARWAANGADTSVQSLPYDSSSLASASARLQGGFTSAAAAQEGTLAWRFAQKDNLRIVLPGDLYAMDTPAPGTNVPSQSEVDAKVAAHLQSANDAFRDAFTPIAMALRSPPSVLNRLSMAVSAARASTATSALNSGGAAFFEAMFNAYIAAGRPASATDPRMANEAYLEEATTRMATDIAAAETPEEKAAALANAEEVMRTIARLSTDFDIGPDGRLVSTAVSEAYWRRAQQNLAAAQELNRTTTDRVLAFVRRFAPGLFAGSAVALASGIDPATIADIATQAGSALASYLTPDSTAGGVLATLGLMPGARSAVPVAVPDAGAISSPAETYTDQNSVAQKFVTAERALRQAEANAESIAALTPAEDAYRAAGDALTAAGLGVDSQGDIVNTDGSVIAYQTADGYAYTGTPEWSAAKKARETVAVAPEITPAGAPLLESPDGASVSDAEGKTSTPMPGVPAGLSPLTPAGLKALDTIAQNFQAEDFARANGYTIRSKAPGPIAALFGVPASDWYYKGDTPVGPVENPAAAPDGYTSLPRQVANSSFGKALQVVMPLTLISPAPVLQATVAAGDIASSVVVGSLHVLGDIVGLSPAQSAELPRDVVAQTVVEPKMASPLVLPLISKGPQVDFNVTLAEVYQQSKVKNGNHPGTDLYPWAKYSSEERAMAVAYQTHNPAGMKWPFIFELMGAPGGQPGPYADFFNVARMGADGQVDPTSVIAGKINIVPSKTPFVSFVSFADAEAAMAMKLAYQSEYKNVKTFGDVVRNWVAVDNVSPYLNSGSYTTQAKISGDTPLIRTTNNLIDPAQMARIGIGMPYAEYSNLFKNAGVKHPITGEPVTTAAQLITPEVQRDGLFKVYERVQPGAADAWLADQKRIAAEKATAPASVAKEAAGKSNVSTPPTAPRVTATADEKKEAKAKELVAQWRAKKQVGFGPAVAARLVLDGYDDTQEYVNWRDAAAKQLAGRATVEAPSSTELGIADTLIKLNVRYDVSFAEMAAELSRRGLITSAQYKTLRGFIADGLAQKAGRATTDADRIAADAAIANEMDPTLGHQVTKSGRIYFPGVEYVYELPQGFGTPAERIASKKEGHIMHQVGGWAKDHIARFKTNALRGAGVRVPFLIGDGRGSNDGAVFVFAPNTQEMSWKDNWQGRFLFGGMERESSKLLSTEVGGNAPNIGLTNPLTKAQERAILVNVAFTELAYGFGPAAVVAHNNEENACEGCPGAVLAQELGSVNPYATVSKLIAFADKSVAARAVALAGADAKPSPKTPGTVVIPKGTTLVDSAQFFASLPAATTFLTIAQAGLVSERLISEKVAEAQKTAGMPEVETDQLTGLVKVTEASGEQFVTLKGNGSRLKVVPPKSGNGVYEFRPVEASPVKTASLASIVQAAQKVRNLFGAAKRASLAAKEAAANQRLASLSAAVDEAHAVTSTELANYQTAEQKLAWVTGVVTTHAEFPNGRLTDANLASLPVGATVIVGGWLSDDGLADYANEARRILDFQTGGTPKNFKVVFYTESVTSRSNDMYKPGTSLVKRAVDIAHAREELISVGYPAQRLPNAVNIDSMDGQSEEMLSRVQTILSAGNFDAVIPNNPTPETVALLRNNGVIVPMVLLEDTAKNPDLEQRALAFAQAGERVLVLNFAQGGDRAMQVKFGSPELQANEAVFSTYPNVSMHLGGNAPRILKEATLSVIPPVVLAKNNPTATVPASSVDSNPPALTLKTTLVPDTAVDATQPVTPPVPEAAPTTFQNLGTFAQMQQAGEAIAADLLDQWRALRPAQKLQPLSLIVAGPSAAELEATRVALNQAADIVFYQQLVPQRPVAEKSVQETVAAQPETMPAEGLPGSPSGVAVSAAPSPQRLFNQILAAFAAPAREPAVPAADAGQVTADAATPKLAFWNRVRMLLSWKSTLQPVATPEVTLAAQPPAETAVPIPATEISAATPAVETVSPSQPKLEVASTAVKAPVVKATAAIGPDDIVVLQAQLNKIADATEAMQKAGVEAKAVGARTVTMHGFFGMPTAEDEAVIAKNLRDLRAAFVKIQVAANAIASAQRAMVSEGVLSASHTAVLTTLADQLAPTQTSRAGDSIPQQMIAKVKAFEALPTFTITGSAKTKQTQKESFKTSLASFASQLESLTRANVAETNGIIASAIRNAPVLETVAKPVVAAGSSPEIAAPLNTEGVAVDITPGVDSAEVARIAQLYTQIKGVFDDMKKAGEELTKAKDRAPLRALPTVVIQIRALDTSVRQLTALVGGIVDSPVVDASMAKSLKEELGTIVANVGSMRSALSDVESHPLTSSYRTVLKDTLVEKGPATQIAGESLSVMLEGAIATAQRSVASHGPALTLKTTQVRTPPEVESAPAAPAVSTLTMPEVEAVAPQVVSAPPSTDPLGDALQGAFGAGGFVVGTRIGGVVGRVVANAVRATGAFLSGAVGSVSNTIASIAARVSSGSGSSSTPRPKTYSLNELKAFAADVERPQGKAEREAPSLVISRIDIYSYAEMTPEMKARITAEKPAAGHTFLYRGLRSVWHRPVLASSVMVSLEAQLSAIMEKSLTGALTEEDKQQLLVLTRLLPNERYQFFSDDVGVALKDAYFAEGGELVRIELTGDQAFAYQMDTPSSSSALNQGTNVIIPREAMLSEESAVAVAGRAAPSAETIPTPAASVPVDSAPVVESMPSVRPQPIETSSIAADLARGLLDLASEPAWTPDRPYAATPEPTTQKAPDDMISRLSAAQNTPPAAPVVAAPAQKSVPSLGAAAHPMLSAVWKYTPGSTSVTKTMTDTAAAADYIRGLLTGGISLRGLSWRSVATAAVSAVWNLLPGSASLTKTVTDMGAAADEAKVLLAKVTKAVSGSAASTGGLRATVPILSDFNPIDYELYREYPSISAAAAPVDLHVVGMTPDKTRVLVVGSEKGTPGRMVGLTGGSQVFALPANHAALDQNALASLHFTNERVADDAYAAATAPAAFVSSVGIPGASPAVVIPPPGGAEIGGTPPWRQWAYIILALLGASTIPQDTAVTVETPKAATSVKLAETAPATVKPSTVAKGGAAAPAPAAEAPAANCPPGSYCSAATPPPAAAPTPAPAAGAPAVPGVAGVPAKAAGATPPPAAGLPDASPDKTTPPAARGAGASAVDTGGGAGGGGEKGAGGAVAPAPASGARTPSAPGTTVTPGATKSPGTGSGTGAGTGGGLANSLGGFAQSLKNFFGLGQPSTPTAAATEAPAATPSTAVPATVATTQKPVVMFIVNPEEVAKGASPVLSWLSVNADGCAVYGPTGLLTPRRTERGTIRNLTIARPTEFALVCAATPNTLTDKKVVRVQGDTSTPVSAVITALPEKAAPAERASIPVSTSAPTTPSSAQSQSGGTPTQGAAQPRVQSCSPRMTSNGQVDQSYIDCLYQNGF